MALKTSIVLQFDGNGALTGLRKVGEATGKVGSKVDAAAGKVDNFDKQNLRLNKTLGRVAHQMAGYFAIFAGGRQILSAVNALGAMDNRLRLVTSSAAELEQVKERIFAIGQASRSSALSVGQLYARVAVASGELGRSQEDLLKLTELTTKAVALSGATASESSAGLIQFAQGLASNRLQGDELRSVLENLPGLARAIAAGLGVTVGEIRTLAAEGKLTAEAVIDAVLAQQQQIESSYAKMVPTIAQGWEVMTNGALKYLDEVNEVTGASAFLAQKLEAIGHNFDDVTDTVVDLAAAFVAVKFIAIARGFSGVGAAAGKTALSVRLLKTALRAIPGLAAIAALTALFSGLRNEIDSNTAALDRLMQLRERYLDGEERAFDNVTNDDLAAAAADLREKHAALARAEQQLQDKIDSQFSGSQRLRDATVQIEALRANVALLRNEIEKVPLSFEQVSNVINRRDGITGRSPDFLKSSFGGKRSATAADDGDVKKRLRLIEEAAVAELQAISDKTERAKRLEQRRFATVSAEYRKHFGDTKQANGLIEKQRLLHVAKLATIDTQAADEAARIRKKEKRERVAAQREQEAATQEAVEWQLQRRRAAAAVEENAIKRARAERRIGYDERLAALAEAHRRQVVSTQNMFARRAQLHREYVAAGIAAERDYSRAIQTELDKRLAAAQAVAGRRKDADFDLARRRAALTDDDGLDDAAVRRDRELARIDEDEKSGGLSGVQAMDARELVGLEYEQTIEEIRKISNEGGRAFANLIFGPLENRAPGVGNALTKAFGALTKQGGGLEKMGGQYESLGLSALHAGELVAQGAAKQQGAIGEKIAAALAEYAAIQAIDLAATVLSLGLVPPGTIIRSYYGSSGGGFLGGGGGGGGGGMDANMVGKGFHGGGIAGGTPTFHRSIPAAAFADAPRLHGGGIASLGLGVGEVPAILKEDEAVFTPEQLRHLGPRGGNNNNAPQNAPMRVELINQSAAELEVSEAGAELENGEVITRIVVDDLNNNGEIARSISNNFNNMERAV